MNLLTIFERFLRRKNRYSDVSGIAVLVWRLLVSSAFESSQSIEQQISPSKLVGYLEEVRVILMLQCELGFRSPDIGSSLRLSPLLIT